MKDFVTINSEKSLFTELKIADYEDLQEILNLQYIAYQTEAALFSSNDIPPLKQTLNEVEDEYRNGIILKIVDKNNVIIGSIRANASNGNVFIGKLMVHPDYRNNGYGTKLLLAIEEYFQNMRYELFTSTKSVNNIRLYEKLGYKIFKQEVIDDELTFVYLEKF